MKKKLLLLLFLTVAALGLRAQSRNAAPLTFYPNPVVDFFMISETSEHIAGVALLNLTGKRVKYFEYVKGEQYYVGDLPKGIYLVQMIDRNDRTLRTHKMDKH
ncbi:MAG: T9SS type A sorting domain-containing protein [Saprospiraceae bacterium]